MCSDYCVKDTLTLTGFCSDCKSGTYFRIFRRYRKL